MPTSKAASSHPGPGFDGASNRLSGVPAAMPRNIWSLLGPGDASRALGSCRELSPPSWPWRGLLGRREGSGGATDLVARVLELSSLSCTSSQTQPSAPCLSTPNISLTTPGHTHPASLGAGMVCNSWLLTHPPGRHSLRLRWRWRLGPGGESRGTGSC